MIAPLLIGFAGVLLGGAALYFSLTGAGASDDANASLKAMQAKAEGLETRLADLEQKYADAISQIEFNKTTLNKQATDTNTAFNNVKVEMINTRDMIDTNADKLAELIDTLNQVGRPAAPAAPTTTTPTPLDRLPVATTESDDDSSSLPVVSTETRMHTIRSGDTFSKLASQYNVTVAAILTANPDVDPRRLAVGQKIKIPAAE